MKSLFAGFLIAISLLVGLSALSALSPKQTQPTSIPDTVPASAPSASKEAIVEVKKSVDSLEVEKTKQKLDMSMQTTSNNTDRIVSKTAKQISLVRRVKTIIQKNQAAEITEDIEFIPISEIMVNLPPVKIDTFKLPEVKKKIGNDIRTMYSAGWDY